MILKGFCLALTAAVMQSAMEGTRKYASSFLPLSSLVYIVAVLDSILSLTVSYLLGAFDPKTLHSLHRPGTFALIVLFSSLLLLVSKGLYQKALSLSPLSLTVPYLSLTPAMLLVSAFTFLGERPSPNGLMGVGLIALAGYLLSRLNLDGVNGGKGGKGGKGSERGEGEGGGCLKRWEERREEEEGGGDRGSERERNRHMTGVVKGGVSFIHVPPHLLTVVTSSSSSSSSSTSSSTSNSPSTSICLAISPLSRPSRLFHSLAARLRRKVGSIRIQNEIQNETRNDIQCGTPNGIQNVEQGTLLTIIVAFTWSVTASLDKLGIIFAPSLLFYFAAQRFVIGCLSLACLLIHPPSEGLRMVLRKSLRYLPLLIAIGTFEIMAVVSFLFAVNHMFVSYVVAIKRTNILISVMAGGLFFKESIVKRLPYVMLMLMGMCLIVIEPHAIREGSINMFHATHSAFMAKGTTGFGFGMKSLTESGVRGALDRGGLGGLGGGLGGSIVSTISSTVSSGLGGNNVGNSNSIGASLTSNLGNFIGGAMAAAAPPPSPALRVGAAVVGKIITAAAVKAKETATAAATAAAGAAGRVISVGEGRGAGGDGGLTGDRNALRGLASAGISVMNSTAAAFSRKIKIL